MTLGACHITNLHLSFQPRGLYSSKAVLGQVPLSDPCKQRPSFSCLPRADGRQLLADSRSSLLPGHWLAFLRGRSRGSGSSPSPSPSGITLGKSLTPDLLAPRWSGVTGQGQYYPDWLPNQRPPRGDELTDAQGSQTVRADHGDSAGWLL